MNYLEHAEELRRLLSEATVNYLSLNEIPLSAVLIKVDTHEPSKSTVEVQFKPGGRDQLLENRYKFPLLSPRAVDENQNEIDV